MSRRLVLAATLVGAILRLARVARLPLVHPDSPAYLDLAAAWTAGRWSGVLGGYYSPLYPIAVAPLMSLGVPAELAGRLTAALAGVATIPLVYLLARRRLGVPGAIAVAAVVALQPALVKASAQVLPETLAGLLLVAWMVAVDAGGSLAFVGAGVLAGLAYLARPEGVLLLPIGMVIGLRRRAGAAVVAYAAVALLTMSPALVALHARTGRWQISGREAVVLGKQHLHADDGIAGAALRHPLAMSAWIVRGGAEQTWHDAVALSPLLWLPFAVGVAGGVRGRPLLVAAAFTWLPLALNPSPRYAVPLLPLLLVPVGAGLVRLADFAPRRAQAAAVALGVALVVQGLWKSHPFDERCAQDVRTVLLTRYGRGQALVAVDGRFAYSAGGRAVVPKTTRPDDALALARAQGASLWLTRPQWLGRGWVLPVPGREVARPCGGTFVLYELDGERR